MHNWLPFAVLLVVCGIAAAVTPPCGVPKIAPLDSPTFDRIIGGITARKNSWPWQGNLLATFDYFGMWSQQVTVCGASLVAEKWIITAAHCLHDNAKSYAVKLGQHDSSIQESTAVTYKVKRVIVHPDYMKRNEFDNDIAIMELETAVQMTDAISSVCLPAAGSDLVAGTAAVVTGWGETRQNNWNGPRPPTPAVNDNKNNRAVSTVLKQVTVHVVDRTKCNSDEHYGGWALDTMICAGRANVDACQGDSGGPLVSKKAAGELYELVGVVSFGFGCGDARYPGVYSRVGLYVPWINLITNNLSSA